MINPINPNKILPSSSERSSPADEAKGRKAGSGSVDNGSASGAVGGTAASDTLTVDKASTLYRHSNIQPAGSAAIDSEQSAKELAAKIAEQFKASGINALIAQGGSISGDMGALLEAAPA